MNNATAIDDSAFGEILKGANFIGILFYHFTKINSMKNDTGAVTAANSKTMNAIEQPKLFAAAADSEAVISASAEESLPTSGNKHKAIQKKEIKKKQDR